MSRTDQYDKPTPQSKSYTAFLESQKTNAVGFDCFTSSKWDRNVCQAHRIEYGGYRGYLHEIDGRPVYRTGATYLADKAAPMIQKFNFLESWRKDFAKQLGDHEKVDEWVGATADFGTIMHIHFNSLITGSATVAFIEQTVQEFAVTKNLKDETTFKAIETAKRNLLALRQFVLDYQFETFAVEQMVTSAALNASTPIDIVGIGTIMTGRGDKKVPTRKWMCLNMKSSENSTDHSLQVAVEWRCVNDTIISKLKEIEDIPVMIGTLRPKKWTKEPTYDLVDYTEKVSEPKIQDTLQTIAQLLTTNEVTTPPKVYKIVWDGPLTAKKPNPESNPESDAGVSSVDYQFEPMFPIVEQVEQVVDQAKQQTT